MSIVLRLQKKCLDKDEDLLSLLREALLISKKLKLKDFEIWITNELKGYHYVDNIEELPKYRKVHCTLKFKNPYKGWLPAEIPQEYEHALRYSYFKDSISELENLLSHNKLIVIDRNSEFKKLVQELFGTECEPATFVSSASVVNIIDNVKTILLEWTLKLEEDGILGNDDLIFTEKEKEAAKSIHIEHFYGGVLGNIEKLGNMSTGHNSTNIYNENPIENKIDELIKEIKTLGLKDEAEVIVELEESKKDENKIRTVLGGLLTRGAETAGIATLVIEVLGML